MKRTTIIAAIMLGTHLIGFTRMEAQTVKMSNGTVFQAGKITVGEKFLEVESKVAVEISMRASEIGISAFTNQAFACTPAHPLNKGDVLDADVSSFEAWSKEKVSLLLGTNTETVKLPILGLLLNGDTGIDETVIPVHILAKVDMKPGVPTNSDGYVLDANRVVKAGDTISAVIIFAIVRSSGENDKLVAGFAILSVEKNSEGNPWFTAIQESLPPGFQTHATGDWKKAQEQLQ